MSIPRINPAVMSPTVRKQLQMAQAWLGVKTGSKTIPNKRRHKTTLTPEMAKDIKPEVTVSDNGNTVQIVLPIDPAMLSTAQQKGAFVGKDGRVHFFTKSKIAKAEKTLRMVLAPYAEMTHKWGAVPVEARFEYFFAYPSGTPQKDRHKIGPMNTRPDAPNITKGVSDTLTEVGFWADDSFVNREISDKARTSGKPFIRITIKNMQPWYEKLFEDESNYYGPNLFSDMDTCKKPSMEVPRN